MYKMIERRHLASYHILVTDTFNCQTYNVHRHIYIIVLGIDRYQLLLSISYQLLVMILKNGALSCLREVDSSQVLEWWHKTPSQNQSCVTVPHE